MALNVGLGLLAAVLMASALASGLIDRAPISFPMVFLALGLAIGPGGVGFVRMSADSPILQTVGVFTLSLVLFLDAVNLEKAQERHDLLVPLLNLGPGTLLVIVSTAGAAVLLLHLPLLVALLLAAILAPSDPVVLREIIQDPRLPSVVRRALSIEAGANDAVVLPIVLVAIALIGQHLGTAGDWVTFMVKLLLVGPLLGFLIGGAGAWLMTQADGRFGVRREFQSLYGIGLVMAAYVAGATIGVDGFLAAFAAGIAVTVLDQTLCDCFLEYGEATSVMAMLASFVFFGIVLSGTLGQAPAGALVLAIVVIFLARPAAITLLLARAPNLSWRGRGFIAWFGPRGLTSLLYALLAVSARLPQGGELLAITGIVVIASVLLHGASAMPLSRWYAASIAHDTQREERQSRFGGLFAGKADDIPRITPEELAGRLDGPDPPLVLDVRTRSQHSQDHVRIPGSIRVLPDQVRDWAAQRQERRPVVLYCT